MHPHDQTLGELAAKHPEATRVFLRHRLDFCCGGRRSLGRACEQAGLDPDAILGELDAERAGAAPKIHWDERPTDELVDHIEQHYHAALRRDVPPLIEAAVRVERVHAAKPEVPKGLADLLIETWDELERHMAKEENVLFPALRRGARGQGVYMPVRVMELEHDAHGEHLKKLRAIAHDLVPPAVACATWRALYSGLEKLEADLMEHIHLENNVLFLRVVQP